MAGGSAAPMHVHLGAGRLGLGFTVYATKKVGYEVVVANRAGEIAARLAEDLAYRIQLGPERAEIVSINGVLTFSDEDDTELCRLIADPRCRLLTTAVTGPGLDELVPLLRRALAGRQGDDSAPLFVIPCENQIGPAFDDLRHEARSDGVHFLRCTVDRVCMDIRATAATPSVTVWSEQYANWVIEAPPRLEHVTREHLVELAMGDIADFVPDIVPWMWRKRWLVNGVHLVVALLAWRARFPRLNEFVVRPEGRVALRGVQGELTQALLARTKVMPYAHLVEFNDEVFTRFATQPDLVARTLRRFRYDDLEGFFRDFAAKVGEPSELFLGETGTWAPWATTALWAATQLVAGATYPVDLVRDSPTRDAPARCHECPQRGGSRPPVPPPPRPFP